MTYSPEVELFRESPVIEGPPRPLFPVTGRYSGREAALVLSVHRTASVSVHLNKHPPLWSEILLAPAKGDFLCLLKK